MNTHAHIKASFAGVLSYFGLLAYPHERDSTKAEEFKEALFWAQCHLIEGHTAKEFAPSIGPTGKPWARLKQREYQPRIDKGLKRIFEGHRLMLHLYNTPDAGVSANELKDRLRGQQDIEQGNFYRQMKPLLPAMALHYGLACVWRGRPCLADIMTAAFQMKRGINSLGTAIAESNAPAWEGRTGVQQVIVSFWWEK